MRNPIALLPIWSPQQRLQRKNISILALFLLTTLSLAQRTQAAPPATAPAEVKNLLTQVDAAANRRDVRAVMQFYSPNFTHSDGLTSQTMAQSLTQLWQRYPQLKYQTRLQSWTPQGRAIIAETVTSITGTQVQDNRNMILNATIKSQQRLENNRIVRQDILWERSQLKAGARPPTVDVRLPVQVKAGQEYNFDAIVQESLGDDYLLGAVVEEPIRPENYLQATTPVELQLLPAGGLFKVGRAPATAANYWISAILVRGDGMTLVTQRLQVGGRSPSTPNPVPQK